MCEGLYARERVFIDFYRLSVESGPVPHCSNSKLYPDMVLSVESYAREDQPGLRSQ